MAVIVSLCGLFFSIGLVQANQTPVLQATRLETFARQPTARIIWSKEVGRIESFETRVVVTAFVVKDEVQPDRRMRGIRIDLTGQTATDRVYLEEPDLDVVKRALEEIESGIEKFRGERGDAPLRYLGACDLWQPRPTVHTLSPAYYIAPDSSGLSLSAFKQQDFRFPNRRPAELAEALLRAMDELKHH